MGLMTLLSEAFGSLGKNKVRSFLSMLGIVIGVGAVIAMVALGEGAKARVRAQIAALGDDWIMIGFWGIQRAGVTKQGGTSPNLAEDDAAAMVRDCPTIRAATPSNSLNLQLISNVGNYQTRVMGAYSSYFDIRTWKAVAGTEFSEEDSALRNRVIVLGQTVARELFGETNPLDQTIRIRGLPFTVIGVLESKGTSSDGRDNDDTAIIPWETFKQMLAGTEVAQTIFAAAKPGIPLAIVKQQVRSLLRARHKLDDEDDDDFRIIDRAMTAQADAEATQTFNTLLMAIASISLVVGGVGIMNIMLVSVTERTREIGLRMAIGANGGHILGQFLVEAIVLCAVGGLMGFAGGLGAAHFLHWKWNAPIVVSYWMAGVAIGFAAGVGLFFGFYPAWRASRLNPIEALRYE
jgi:putative ABC transport system permease protein